MKRCVYLFLLSILLVAGVLFLVMFVVAPQLVRTLLGLQSSIPVFFGEVRQWLEKLFAEDPYQYGADPD